MSNDVLSSTASIADARLQNLREKRAQTLQGGGRERIEKQHTAGKLTARKRIKNLVGRKSLQEVGWRTRLARFLSELKSLQVCFGASPSNLLKNQTTRLTLTFAFLRIVRGSGLASVILHVSKAMGLPD